MHGGSSPVSIAEVDVTVSLLECSSNEGLHGNVNIVDVRGVFDKIGPSYEPNYRDLKLGDHGTLDWTSIRTREFRCRR